MLRNETIQKSSSEKNEKILSEERTSNIDHFNRIIHLIHSTEDLDEILLPIKDSIISLLNADRVTIYEVDNEKSEIYSKVKTGAVPREIRVPINEQSIVGYVASTGARLSINDAYNENELKAIYPDLKFDRSWDKQTGYHTRQILAQPIVYNRNIVGVIQIINKSSGQSITPEDRSSFQEIAEVLGPPFYNYHKKMVKYKTKFDYLIKHNFISGSDLEKAEEEAQKLRCDTGEVLIKIYKISKSIIGKSLSAYYNVNFFEYDNSYIPPVSLIDHIKMKNPAKFMRHNGWAPYKKENERIVIVCEDPADDSKISDIQLLMGNTQFDFMVGLHSDINRLIDKLTGKSIKPLGGIDYEWNEAKLDSSKDETNENDSVIVKLVNQTIWDAFNKSVSDIHIETYPGKQNSILRFRLDGECFFYKEILSEWKKAFVARIKIMANLDIAERRLPQDGKIKLKFGTKKIELRVVTVPTYGGNEDVVMRILSDQKPLPPDKLNLSPMNQKIFFDLISKPYGIFLVAGPTGSGKTTTLHSALGHINKPERKIWTAEDPVEITQKGLRQVQMHPKIGLTFAAALRAFLRADPDVIMIGEMRDHETSKMGIEASLTGHLVFSTLHTNSATDTIIRLIDLGIDPFNFADALLGVLAQRLVKTLCPFCKEQYKPTEKELDDLANEYGEKWWPELKENAGFNTMHKPKGCSKCNNSGFKGRTGVHEILVVNHEIKRLIQKKAPVDEIRDAAIKHGMKTLKQDGIWKVLKGDTTIEKIRAVCSV